MKSYYVISDVGAVGSLMRFHAPELNEIVPDPEEIWLITSLGVNEKHRGHGYASCILRDILNDADAEDVTLVLSVAGDGTGLGDEELRAWYARYGFVVMLPEDENALYRPPRKPAA